MLFASRHSATRPIVRERYNDDRDAARELAIHTRATNSRRGPEAPKNRFLAVSKSLAGRVIRRGPSGNSFSPTNNESFR